MISLNLQNQYWTYFPLRLQAIIDLQLFLPIKELALLSASLGQYKLILCFIQMVSTTKRMQRMCSGLKKRTDGQGRHPERIS